MIYAKSYFSGAGGMDLGLTEAGIEITDSYEIDHKAAETLRQNVIISKSVINRLSGKYRDKPIVHDLKIERLVNKKARLLLKDNLAQSFLCLINRHLILTQGRLQ